MLKKEKIPGNPKPQKPEDILNNEIAKIIEVTEEQNLAIRKILKNKNIIFNQKEEI